MFTYCVLDSIASCVTGIFPANSQSCDAEQKHSACLGKKTISGDDVRRSKSLIFTFILNISVQSLYALK